MDDLEALNEGMQAVHGGQIPHNVPYIEVPVTQPTQPAQPAEPQASRQRWFSKNAPKGEEYNAAKIRGKALKVQLPLLKNWRVLAVLAVFLFFPSARVIGMDDSFAWIVSSGCVGVVCLLLMTAGIRTESARLGVFSWQLAVMALLMPGFVYFVAYGLTVVFKLSGFQF